MTSGTDVLRPPEPSNGECCGSETVSLVLGPAALKGDLHVPPQSAGLVLFAHGSGSGRFSPRNRQVADTLNDSGFATLLFDLLTGAEGADRRRVFDIDLLEIRLRGALRWARLRPDLARLPIGLFGASTGAAAALAAASEELGMVSAVVSRGGRPDLVSRRRLAAVAAPTLLVVGGSDHEVLRLNRRAASELRCEHRLLIVPGATHLFEEPGALEDVALAAGEWFARHLTP